MKVALVLLVPVMLLASCTRTMKVFTREELQDFANDSLDPVGTYFWDEFGQYRDLYNLNDEESVILGEWRCFRGGIYYFFPNKLFVCRTVRVPYKDDPTKLLEAALGIWSVREHVLYVSIFGFDVSVGRTEHYYDETATHEYVMVDPYEVKIINTAEIMPAGYTRNFFAPIEPPKSIKKKLVIQRRTSESRKIIREILKKGVGTLRKLYQIHVITGTGRPEKIYGLFRLVPRMAEENVSALDIVMNPLLVDEYFVQSLTFPYEDIGYLVNPGAAPLEL